MYMHINDLGRIDLVLSLSKVCSTVKGRDIILKSDDGEVVYDDDDDISEKK